MIKREKKLLKTRTVMLDRSESLSSMSETEIDMMRKENLIVGDAKIMNTLHRLKTMKKKTSK